uniref:Major allergen protein n=1 Tax=Anthocharis cardamines TaxID=227532 RepID=B2KSG3_ANTCA|nr:major allergen protein [Anthocharis cardamines]
MKTLIVLSLVCLGWAAPQSGKSFQDYFKEFLDISVIFEGAHHERQTNAYLTYPEFQKELNAIEVIDFKQLNRDLETVPEYKAVVTFLKEHTIDVNYYIEFFENFVDEISAKLGTTLTKHHNRQRRHPMTGRTLNTSIVDTVSMLPRRQLRMLFHEKMAHDELFRTTIEALRSQEWKELYRALWANRTFMNIVNALAHSGFDLKYFLEEFTPALFGQNIPVYVSFQNQFDEFLDIYVALEKDHVVNQFQMGYLTFPEFHEALDYMDNTNLNQIYQNLLNEPEFKAIDSFLKKNGVYVAYYIDRLQLLIKEFNAFAKANPITTVEHPKRQRRHPITGTTLVTYVVDTVSMMPTRQLRALFDDKMANNEVFKSTVEALRSEEFKQLYKALWENEAFKNVAATLAEHDFDLKYFIEDLSTSMFGQNIPVYVSFQNQFDEFLDIINEKTGSQFVSLVKTYLEFPEFRKSLDFLDNTKFRQVYQALNRDVPEFKEGDTYLKSHDVFTPYYIDRLQFLVGFMNSNVTFDGFGESAYRKSPQNTLVTGRTMSTFLADFVNMLPKRELEVLFDDKMSENKEFITGVEALRSSEWTQIYESIWANKIFQDVAASFASNDFDLRYVFEDVVLAMYGQN